MYKPRGYKSFEEFEREELLRMDSLYSAIDDIVDELFLDVAEGTRARANDETDFDEW